MQVTPGLTGMCKVHEPSFTGLKIVFTPQDQWRPSSARQISLPRQILDILDHRVRPISTDARRRASALQASYWPKRHVTGSWSPSHRQGSTHPTPTTPVPQLRRLQTTNDMTYACQREWQSLLVEMEGCDALSPQIEYSHVSRTAR